MKNKETSVYPLHYLERYRNEGTRTYSKHSDYSEAEQQYRPDYKDNPFLIKVYEVPKEELLIYRANPPEPLKKKYLGEDTACFCVHPQVTMQLADDPYLQQIRKKGVERPGIPVVPTSSTRTLFVLDGVPHHAVKVHFPFRVSRYGRKMRDEVIEQAINVSLDLERGIQAFDGRFAFLREVIGVAYRNLDEHSSRGENWGYLVRDMSPYPQATKPGNMIPGFALYGRDLFEPEKPPLLYELIGDSEPLQFVLENIMLPVVRHWVQCYTAFGYMLEPHGQNCLFEVTSANSSMRVIRIVHRDLSLGINIRLREDKNLSSGHLNSYNKMDGGIFASITYDMFMGSHFFERIIECCLQKYPHLNAEAFRAPCRETFAQLFPDHADYMPPSVHYFSEKRDKFNKPLYQDTGRQPLWRP